MGRSIRASRDARDIALALAIDARARQIETTRSLRDRGTGLEVDARIIRDEHTDAGTYAQDAAALDPVPASLAPPSRIDDSEDALTYLQRAARYSIRRLEELRDNTDAPYAIQKAAADSLLDRVLPKRVEAPPAAQGVTLSDTAMALIVQFMERMATHTVDSRAVEPYIVHTHPADDA